jgi:multidrug transporter EmrE-like cation transporter
VMAACSAAGLLLFQTALQRCRISIVAPVSNVLGSIYFLVAGTWLFHERLPADPVRLTLRLVGIVLACCVVALLSRQPATGQPEPHAPEPHAPDQGKARRTWRKEGEAHGFRRDVA